MKSFSLAVSAVSALGLLVSAPLFAQGTSEARENLKPYPAAKKDQTRHVIFLPAYPNEDELKVELIPGKTVTVDCNIHSFGGELNKATVQGWGFDYYEVTAIGPMMSTLKGCPDEAPKSAFVPMRGEQTIRYNSRLPIVIYTPKDVELHYRLWRAGEVHNPAAEQVQPR